jgi:hypothetical protein
MRKLIMTKPSSGSNAVVVVAIATGLLASIIINNISRLLNIWESLWSYAVALIFFVVVGWLLECFAPVDTNFKTIMKYIGITLAAIAPGVIIDAQIDFFLRHYDRNLFPIEIIMWWIFAPLPLLAGIMLGRDFFEFKPNNKNGS